MYLYVFVSLKFQFNYERKSGCISYILFRRFLLHPHSFNAFLDVSQFNASTVVSASLQIYITYVIIYTTYTINYTLHSIHFFLWSAKTNYVFECWLFNAIYVWFIKITPRSENTVETNYSFSSSQMIFIYCAQFLISNLW